MSALDKDTWRITFGEVKAAAEDIIEEARRGRMFILVDDEDRENEGDLVIPAQCATPEAINFMAKHARGLICLALTRDRVEQLGLPLMAQNNGTRHQTAFTVSIEAREGVTTGISAADRARTVAVAIDRSCGPQDIVTPGHVFPLVARDGGVAITGQVGEQRVGRVARAHREQIDVLRATRGFVRKSQAFLLGQGVDAGRLTRVGPTHKSDLRMLMRR